MLCAISVTPIHRGQKRGDGVGYSGYKHQKGEKIIVMIDNNGSALAPRLVAPVNETDMVLLPKGLQVLKPLAKNDEARLAIA